MSDYLIGSSDSILNAIRDADTAVSQWPDEEHGIAIEVPIDALRWLVHAASMHWTATKEER